MWSNYCIRKTHFWVEWYLVLFSLSSQTCTVNMLHNTTAVKIKTLRLLNSFRSLFVPDCCLLNLTPMLFSCCYFFQGKQWTAPLSARIREQTFQHHAFVKLNERRRERNVPEEYKAIKRIKPDSQHLSSHIWTFPGFLISEQNEIKGLYSLSQAQCSLWNEWRLNR